LLFVGASQNILYCSRQMDFLLFPSQNYSYMTHCATFDLRRMTDYIIVFFYSAERGYATVSRQSSVCLDVCLPARDVQLGAYVFTQVGIIRK